MEVSPRNLVVGDTLEGLGWGSRVWIRQGQAWVLGTLASKVEDSNTEAHQVVTEQGTSLKVSRSDVAPANPPETESGPDLTALPFVSEPGVLRSLEQRFQGEEVYTSAGPVLVAINPFKPVPHLYDAEGHASQSELSQDPHVFSVARRAFEQVSCIFGRWVSVVCSLRKSFRGLCLLSLCFATRNHGDDHLLLFCFLTSVNKQQNTSC